MEVQLDAVDYADAMPFVRRASGSLDVDAGRQICRSTCAASGSLYS